MPHYEYFGHDIDNKVNNLIWVTSAGENIEAVEQLIGVHHPCNQCHLTRFVNLFLTHDSGNHDSGNHDSMLLL